MKATQKAELIREEACAFCAVKDWLENRYEVYLFAEAASTTTWMKHFFGTEKEDLQNEDDEENLALLLSWTVPEALCLSKKAVPSVLSRKKRYMQFWMCNVM